ncbi:MAG TPA: hypothetical protein VG940_04770 [Gemmatimonadales bacterium]|nr:hypothetical protein [Gemmatimonadales bacterium]
MSSLRRACLLVLLTAGCAAREEQPSAWEIVHGTAQLSASKSLDPSTGAVLGDFPTRTGSLTVAADSTVTGWIKLAAGDTVFFADGTAGSVVNDGGLVMVLPGLTPSEYAVITDGDFPDTYGLLSTSSVSGGDVVALHKVYWEFAR